MLIAILNLSKIERIHLCGLFSPLVPHGVMNFHYSSVSKWLLLNNKMSNSALCHKRPSHMCSAQNKPPTTGEPLNTCRTGCIFGHRIC